MSENSECPSCSLATRPKNLLEVFCRENSYNEVCVIAKYGLANMIFWPSLDTPLIVAAENGAEETVKVLIAHGADVDLKGKNSFGPFHRAVQAGFINIAKLLLDFAATPCACSLCYDVCRDIIGNEEEMDFEKELQRMRPFLEGKLVNKLGEIIDINKE